MSRRSFSARVALHPRRALFAFATALLLPLLARPAGAQTCPKVAGDTPVPRIEVHLFQPSCDAPLLSGKPAMGRIWAMWLLNEGASEEDREFHARITVTDGGGDLIHRTTHTFKIPPWEGQATRFAEHTVDFRFTPVRGVTASPIRVVVEPDKESGEDQDLFEDPGVAPFEFEPDNPDRRDGKRILQVSYVIPMFEEDEPPGEQTLMGNRDSPDHALEWIRKNADVGEDFIVQNLPVHAVQRAGIHPIPIEVPDTREAECISDRNKTCLAYELWGFDEQVDYYLARQFNDLADETIVVILLRPGYAGNLFRGKTVFSESTDRARAFLSSAEVSHPDNPVIVIPTDVEAWTLAHEMVHVFRGEGHVGVAYTSVGRPGNVVQTALAEGIHAYRISSGGEPIAIKHSREGNGEGANALEPLLKDGATVNGIVRRFVSDAVYADLLEGVRDSEPAIWENDGADDPAPKPGAEEPTERPENPPGGPPGGLDSRSLSGPSGSGIASFGPTTSGAAPSGLSASGSPPRPASAPDAQVTRAVPHILVGGFIAPSGQVVLDPLRRIDTEGWGASSGRGRYRAELRGPNGSLLAARGFDPSPTLVHDPESRIEPGSSFSVVLPASGQASRVMILDAAGNELASAEPVGSPLDVAFDVAQGPEPGTIRIDWETTAAGPVGVDLDYSPDGTTGWVPVARGLRNGVVVLPTLGLPRGPNPTFRATRTDGFSVASDERSADLGDFQAWSVYPPEGDSTGVRDVWASLNTELDPTLVDEDDFILRDASGSRVPSSIGYDVLRSRVWLYPHEPLEPGRSYRARLSGDLQDRWGNRLESDVEWSFRTVADTRPPRIVAMSPRDGDITIPVTIEPSVAFGEPLAAEDLSGALRLQAPGGESVPGTTRYDPETYTLSFEPATELDLRSSYLLYLSPVISDEGGNPLGDMDPIGFTTGGRIRVGGGS